MSLQAPDRLAALHRTALLDSAAEASFDRLTRLASQLLGAPIALVSLVDADRQFFKSCVGVPEPWASLRETPLSHSLCQHAVASRVPLVIADAREHPLVRESLAVTKLGVIAYAGIPLITAEGHALGSFCAIDVRPRVWTPEELAILEDLAAAALTEIELRLATAEAERQRGAAEALLADSPDAFLALDHAARITYVSDAAIRLLVTPREALLGRDVWALFPEAAAGTLGAAYREAVTAQRPLECEEFFPATGRWFAVHARPTASGMSVFFRDVTERRRAERALRSQHALLEAVIEGTVDGVFLKDAEGRYRMINAAGARMLGCSVEAVVGATDEALFAPDSAAAIRLRDEAMLARGTVATEESVATDAAGVARTYHTTRTPWRDASGRIIGVIGISRDVTERKQLEEQLVRQALHDALTGLANRVLFRDRVEHALAIGRRPGGRTPVVLFIDLDHFKSVNDALGHAAGDRLLAEVARRLSGALRASDTCARLGGDEFAVLLEQHEGDDVSAGAAAGAERVLATLRTPFVLGETEVVVGASIGIAVPGPADGVEELLRNADLAMYRAKTAGRGRYELFEPAMHAAVRQRLETKAELRQALEGRGGGELVLFYQPIVRLADGHVTGVEALVRWRHPERGLVPPLEFIPLAEDTGLIVPLGRRLLHEACQQLACWHRDVGADPAHVAAAVTGRAAAPLSLSLNISGRQLADDGLVHDVAAALAASGIPPACLVLELTESMLIDDGPAMLARLGALKALGVRLAIDDFGTGYSSLAYLERFPIDVLKIDRAFVGRLGTPGAESPLAAAVLGLGGALGMRVVAEGVETTAQIERLQSLGCELGQGYHFARPMPAEDVAAYFGNVAGIPGGASRPDPGRLHVA